MMTMLLLLAIATGAFLWSLLKYGKRRFVVANKDVLITGAANGIGRELANEFAKERAKTLVLWDLDAGALEIARKHISHAFPHVNVCVRAIDVSDSEDVRKAFDKIEEDGQFPSIVVNNAGTLSGKSFLQMEEKDVKRTIGTNLLAHFWVLREFFRRRGRRREKEVEEGAIVTVASLMGHMAGVRLTDYGASKWGCVGFHESLRMEIRAAEKDTGSGMANVHPMLVCPYVVDTRMFCGAFDVSRAPWYVSLVWRIFPKLRTENVAKAIVRGLVAKKDVLVLPWYFRIVPPLLQLLPAALRDLVQELAGARDGMRGFVGAARTKRG